METFSQLIETHAEGANQNKGQEEGEQVADYRVAPLGERCSRGRSCCIGHRHLDSPSPGCSSGAKNLRPPAATTAPSFPTALAGVKTSEGKIPRLGDGGGQVGGWSAGTEAR